MDIHGFERQSRCSLNWEFVDVVPAQEYASSLSLQNYVGTLQLRPPPPPPPPPGCVGNLPPPNLVQAIWGVLIRAAEYFRRGLCWCGPFQTSE